MKDTRQKDKDWTVELDKDGRADWDAAQLAVLMDIRDELCEVRSRLSVLQCTNFLRIPLILRNIDRNTRKKSKKVKP